MIGVLAKKRKSCGFTLLEMLVATAMMAVLAGSFYATLRIALTARSSSAAAVEPVRKTELALELLREDLQSAMVPKGLLAGALTAEDRVDLEGRASDYVSVHCAVGAADRSGRPGDVRKVEIFCEMSEVFGENGEGEKCLVRCTTWNLLATQAEEPTREVICRGVYAFNVRYFDGSDWQDSWDSTGQGDVLPLAAEVTIQLSRRAGDLSTGQTDLSGGGYTMMRVFPIFCSSLQPGVSIAD